MLDEQGAQNYWGKQVEKGGMEPCHYLNKWQDKYAFEIRTSVFRRSDFRGLKKIVDIGCGVGDYTAKMFKLIDSDAHIVGFYFSFNIEIARKKHRDLKNIVFKEGSVPDENIESDIKSADAVIMTTVYTHLTPDSREILLGYFEKMKSGAKMFILEYFPEVVPEFQKNQAHKIVESSKEVQVRFINHGLQVLEVRPVNYIDSFLFFHWGKNWFVYFITKWLDNFVRVFKYYRSKYKLIIFTR